VYNKNNKFKKSHKPINSKILNALFLFIVFGFQHTTFAGNFFTENPDTTEVEHVEYWAAPQGLDRNGSKLRHFISEC